MKPVLVTLFLATLASEAIALGLGDLTGSWTAVRADVEKMTFTWYKAQLEFRSSLNQRPFESGEWDLRGDSLFLYGSSRTRGFAVTISGDTLRLREGESVQVFVKMIVPFIQERELPSFLPRICTDFT